MMVSIDMVWVRGQRERQTIDVGEKWRSVSFVLALSCGNLFSVRRYPQGNSEVLGSSLYLSSSIVCARDFGVEKQARAEIDSAESSEQPLRPDGVREE